MFLVTSRLFPQRFYKLQYSSLLVAYHSNSVHNPKSRSTQPCNYKQSRALSESGYTPTTAQQDDHWSRTKVKKKLSFTNINIHTDNINIHSCHKVNVLCNMQNILRKEWGFQNMEV